MYSSVVRSSLWETDKIPPGHNPPGQNPLPDTVVDSPDTDVLILLFEVHHRLPAANIFLTGKRNLTRNIAVQTICEKLGEKRTSAMMASMLSQEVICQGDLHQPRWRRPPFWNQLNGHNSAIFEWIRTKFDTEIGNTVTHYLPNYTRL